ncbi:MAG: UDP-N-acetylmuramoyl-L-alanine--D-glutamate ligase, partial [Oscillospiraceae bacterium]|nr:UDP-N-acetylmuramoyl-L-alanine--D-glutamate ligase [Oscillospiraceae bacterium]
GMHNVENYMAACCAVSGMVDDDIFRQVAREFSGVQHRLELIRTHNGVKYINDSIASSPTRAVAGLRSFKAEDSIILIAGGHDKHVPFDEMAEEVCKRCKALFLCGESAQAIANAVKSAEAYYKAFPMFIYEDWTENVLAASAFAENGDTVLLSPACSSFDFFKNFAERGNLFRKIVMELE